MTRSTGKRSRPRTTPGAPPERVRLQKFLSDAGVASRRHSEELILTGRVLVNNEVIDELPAFVDPRRDRVIVGGNVVKPQKLRYFMINKPKGVVCTNRDPAGRLRAVDLLPPIRERLFSVGRLDEESTGLLLLTNDGELSERLAHPRFGVEKKYRAEVRGRVPDDLPEQLKQGVYLSEGRARAAHVEVQYVGRERSVLMITLKEGRNRQIRRMFAKLGFVVRTLKRVALGPLSVKNLPVGAARELAAGELRALREEIERSAASRSRKSAQRSRAGSTSKTRKRGTSGPATTRPADGDAPSGPRRRLIT